MDQIFKLAQLQNGPITAANYIEPLNAVLRAEVPPTVTTKDVENWMQAQTKTQKRTKQEDDSEQNKTEILQEDAAQEDSEEEEYEQDPTGTTPLHAICAAVDPEIGGEELAVVEKMIDVLFEWGAGWMILDENDETPGCIALRRKLPDAIYRKFVQAGTRAEVFLRRMSSLAKQAPEEDDANEDDEAPALVESDPAVHQDAYLASDLAYTDHALVTKDKSDGVMMDWETPIMKRSAEVLTIDSDGDNSGPVVLNVGFGMGIIDGFIQDLKPKAHYICEAHPDVLKKMKADGWYEKPGVHVLEGRWQDSLAKLLNEGKVYFDGMYYDTFSEHYTDLVEFFDSVVGLLKPHGVFSFFNGLGADRQICYDVYCDVLEIDLTDYGLEVKFEDFPIATDVVDADKSAVWQGIRKQYWAINVYKFPHIKFIGA